MDVHRRHLGGAGPDTPTPDQTVALGQAALDAGCTDPLVRYCYARVLQQEGRGASANSYFGQAFQDMITSDYSALRVFSEAMHADGQLGPRDQGLWQQTIVDCSVDACRQPKAGDSVSRVQAIVGLENVMGFLEQRADSGTGDLKLLQQVVGELQKDRAAWPYATECLAGLLEIQEGWKARGGGWASTVTDAGWKSFAEHGVAARRHFEAAWKLDPHLPNAPTYMMTVVLMDAQNPTAEARQWFERATSADLEYGPAWTNYFWVLRPRWFGSEGDMLRLGMEALDTGRFDTSVPAEYLTAVQNVANDEQSPRVWRLNSVRNNIEKMADGYLKVLKNPAAERYLVSLKIAAALSQRQYEDAYALLAKLPDHHVDPSALTMMMLPAQADEQIEALGGPDHAALAKAAAEAQQGDVEAASEDYTAALQKLKPHSPAARYATAQLAILGQRKQLAGGHWVDIQPQAGLAGWRVAAGSWKVNGAALEGTSDAHGLALVYGAPVGDRFEISGHLQVVKPVPGTEPRVGPMVSYRSLHDFWLMCMRTSSHRVGLINAQYSGIENAGPTAGNDDFDVTDYDGQMAAVVDGKPVFSHTPLPEESSTPSGRVGLGAVEPGVGLEVKLTHLRLRLLTAEPVTTGPKLPWK